MKSNNITITKAAADRLNHLRRQEENPNACMLRITVDAGGCSGFQYKLEFDSTFNKDEDAIFEKDGAKVIIDNISLNMIDGATLDYKQEMIGSAFVITNPNAKMSCGCGNSFSL